MSLSASCITRGSPARFVMRPTVPGLDTSEFGMLNCGVLNRLKTSQRNSSCRPSPPSLKGNDRSRLKSRLVKGGPIRMSRPEFPNAAGLGTAKQAGLNHSLTLCCPLERPPLQTRLGRVSAKGPTKLLSDEAVTVKGKPEFRVKMPFIRQLPGIAAGTPVVAHWCPFPNGKS